MQELIIHKNRRAKTLKIRINKKGQPVLTIPWFCPKGYALNWAQKQQGWIEKHAFTPQQFQNGQQISLCGKNYTLVHTPTQRTNRIQGEQIIIGGDITFFQRRTKDFIKAQFLNYLKQHVPQMTQRLSVSYGRISLRDTSSRWGSCSSLGNLSFCWRIALAPEFVITYLIAHEVSHLKYMNHSPAFWKTVATLTPDTIRAKNWLKYHSGALHIC